MWAHEYIGLRFNRLLVVGVRRRNGTNVLECKCDCGNTSIQELGNIRRVMSCGCFRDEGWRHGDCKRSEKAPEYAIWVSMIQRCTNKRCAAYKLYGARGITVARRWYDYRNFIADVGERPSEDLSLERIDNDKGYEPGNVRWATTHDQNRNRRGNWKITYRDEIRCIVDWANDPECVVSVTTLRKRLLAGWKMKDAMQTPPKKVGRWLWAADRGLPSAKRSPTIEAQ